MPFRDIIGHRALVALLSRAIDRGTLPQSLIFAGPDGVGKRLTALAVAQAHNCLRRAAAGDDLPVDACGECAVCRRIAQGMHPDVLVLPAGVNLDETRAAIEAAGYRPFEGRHRVFILDEADRLSSEIQNALLKSLEEPPASSSFILVTARPDLLLPTVQSRCPALRFGRLPAADLERLLRERFGCDVARAQAAAVAGEGSVARALMEASEEGAATRDLVEQVLKSVQTARGPADRLRAAGLLLEPGDVKPRARAKSGSKWATDRDLLAPRLSALSAALRDLAAMATGASPRALAAAPSATVQALVKAFGAERLIAAFAAVDEAQQALEQNVNAKTVADWLAFQL
jgi:DNA polymerase III subunit delta'